MNWDKCKPITFMKHKIYIYIYMYKIITDTFGFESINHIQIGSVPI